jgi:glutamine amidotransferase
MSIGIVDLEMGNLRSVANAVTSVGCDPKWVRRPADLEGITHVILPGVGSFKTAADNLDALDLRGVLVRWAEGGAPLLGICLGMQLLGGVGEEGGEGRGLGVVGGRITRLDPTKVPSIPHVGWNEAKLRRKHPVFDRVKSGVDFYYVHSYHFVAAQDDDVLATVEYGGSDYASVVASGSVLGVQFHPEKSQANGVRIVENFCYWDGRC